MATVSDTSPIFNLACIGRLNLLHEQFGDIWIPEAVRTELQGIPDAAVRKTIDQAIQAGWLGPRDPSDANLVSLLSVELHQGEAEAIALAVEVHADRLLIDEREGRATARLLGLHVTGVLGVLLRGKKMGHVRAIKPEIEVLRSKAGFFIAPALEQAILAQAGESGL
jgi:predicted nucleic acid-binding protein